MPGLFCVVGGCSYPIYPAKAVLRKHSSRIVIPSEVEGSFSLAVRGSVPDSEKWETLYRRKGGDGASPKRLNEGVVGKRGRKRFLAALEMTVCGMNNQCKVKEKRKARFPYRHPERSRGIFFVGGKRERARQREMGNTVSRKDGRRCFL